MNIATRLRYGLARMLLKANTLSMTSPWIRTSFLEPTFDRLVSEGYEKNSIVAACISVYTFMFPEPPLLMWDDDSTSATSLPKHPLRKLLQRPNPIMGEDELWQYTVSYMAVGGNAFWVVGRDARGAPAARAIFPYHMGQVRVKPGGPTWIRGYEFYNEKSEWVDIDPDKYIVVHFKWPLPDMNQPWQALPPLRSGSASVDSDSELDRYLYALLKNDAVPPTVIRLRENQEMGQEEKDTFRARWMQMFGGTNRGSVAVLDDGMSIERIALNLEELAVTGLRGIPETRIPALFRIPPIVVGLQSGLDKATYSNYEQARAALTRDGLIPLWRAAAAEVQSAFGDSYPDLYCRHDLSQVGSLQEDVNAKWARVDKAYLSGYMGWSESRSAIGLPEQAPPNDLFYLPSGAQLIPGAMLGQTMPALPAPQPVEAAKQFKRIRRDDLEDMDVMDAARRLVEEVRG